MGRMNLLSWLFLTSVISTCFFSCKETPDFNAQEQLSKDVKAIDDYLNARGIQAYKDMSGIRLVIDRIGSKDLPPKRSHTATVTITGKFLGGTVVENTRTLESQIKSLPLQGLVEGVEIMPVGTLATLYIPSGLAYGNTSTGPIPANSNLMFEVELIKVVRSAEEITQMQADSVAIDAYLSSNSISAQKGPFGFRFVIKEQGTATAPFWYDKIKVNYAGKLLTTNTTFYSGISEPNAQFDSRVVDYLPGLQLAFRLLPVGSKATVYIPSVLGFGSDGAGGGLVPANANLIYEINSVEIVN